MTTEDTTIHLILQGQNQEEVHFKIKKDTPLKKLFDKYCERNGKYELCREFKKHFDYE